MKMKTLLTCVVVILLAACGAPASPATFSPLVSIVSTSTQAPAPSTSNSAVIIYERSGGFAGQTDTWRIFADGHVEAATHSNNTAAPALTTAEVNLAAQQIAQAGFFDLQGSYLPDNHCCDLYTYRLTVALDGKSKTVTTMDGAQQPAALATAITIVRALINQ
jgi:hypothetical protein